MARNKRGRRDDNPISSGTLPRRPSLKWDYVAFNKEIRNFRRESLEDYEDRRRFHPLQAAAPALSYNQRRSLLTLGARPANRRSVYHTPGYAAQPLNLFSATKAAIAFARPRRVLVCIRRKIRREVMHALMKTGAGQGKQKPPIRNWLSQISCT